jgi:methylase of polypeptide subunit release factors
VRSGVVQLNGGVTEILLDQLRDDLAAADYSVAALTGLWGAQAADALHRGHRVPALRALQARRDAGVRSAADTLATAFVLGIPVAYGDLDEALPSLGVDGAITLGLVAFQAGPVAPARSSAGHGARSDAEPGLHPQLDLRPYSFVDATGVGSWWIASDLGELALGHPLREDHVLGIGGASVTLSGLMIQTPVGRALDLGTGCGIQAMHASRHAEHVVATDISERALWLARLNARLNGIHNIEFRQGSLFEPVAGEQFDQIVSNPPFVITPRSAGVPAYEYRDGGMLGDELIQSVITSTCAHLAEGGIAQYLGNWESRGSGADGLERVAQWLDAPGARDLDAWVIERDLQAVGEYAETWIRDGGTRHGTPQFDQLYNAWLDDFDARGVSRVGFGYVLLRRPVAGRPPFRRIERQHGSLGSNEPGGLGAHLAACLRARDWESVRDEAQLGASRVVAAPDVTEERHYWPGADDPTALILHQGSGFARSLSVDTLVAAFVGASDGELTVDALVSALSELLQLDVTLVAADLIPRVRSLIDDGFLVPVEE